MIKGTLSWYSLQQCHRLFIILLFSSGCVLCSLTCDYEVTHGTSVWGKNRLWHSAGEFSPFIFADLWQLKRLWLIWSVPLTAMTHSSFPVSGCHLSLLVKSPQTRRKPQQQLVNIETKLLGFTPRLWAFITTTFFFLFVDVKVAQENARVHIHSGVEICLAKSLHINLFGRNDKNQSVRTAAALGMTARSHRSSSKA